MKRAVFPMTDEEREDTVEHDKVLLARVLAEIAPRGDMEQMPEPEGEVLLMPSLGDWIGGACLAVIVVATPWIVWALGVPL